MTPAAALPEDRVTLHGFAVPAARSAGGGAGLRGLWLITFTDLVCLMLAFFVLWFSMTDQRGARRVSVPAGTVGATTGALFGVERRDAPRVIDNDYLAAVLSGHFRNQPVLGIIGLERDPDQLRLILPEQDQTGGEEAAALFLLGGLLSRTANRIEVLAVADGMADDFGVRLRQALGRAVAVSGTLSAAGVDRPLAVRAQVAPGRADAPGVVIVIRDW